MRLTKKYRDEIYRYYFPPPLDPYIDDNYRLTEIIIKYFLGYERNLIGKIGTFIEEEKYTTSF